MRFFHFSIRTILFFLLNVRVFRKRTWASAFLRYACIPTASETTMVSRNQFAIRTSRRGRAVNDFSTTQLFDPSEFRPWEGSLLISSHLHLHPKVKYAHGSSSPLLATSENQFENSMIFGYQWCFKTLFILLTFLTKSRRLFGQVRKDPGSNCSIPRNRRGRASRGAADSLERAKTRPTQRD